MGVGVRYSVCPGTEALYTGGTTSALMSVGFLYSYVSPVYG